eukprot:655361-Pelagomonas_calceolata.AAC.1
MKVARCYRWHCLHVGISTYACLINSNGGALRETEDFEVSVAHSVFERNTSSPPTGGCLMIVWESETSAPVLLHTPQDQLQKKLNMPNACSTSQKFVTTSSWSWSGFRCHAPELGKHFATKNAVQHEVLRFL